MSWGLVAVAGATVLSGTMSSQSASKQAKVAGKASDASMAFEQVRYDDWKAVYGPLQDNLSSYYQNVTPDYYAAVGLEAFEQQYQTGLQRLDESFTQRGIDPSSGIAASLEQQAELGAAETRAGIRREAPRQAAEDKSRFLQIGLGQNPASSVSNSLSQSAKLQQQQAGSAGQAAGQAWGSAIESTGRAIDAYNTQPSVPPSKVGVV
tara:strand:+ start:5860 stop:6480 length:621 start_codon:yes stop_codon:yes gene_type:complete